MSFSLWILTAAAILGLVWLTGCKPPGIEERAGETVTAKVAHVIDGDTFYLDNYRTRIRLWGVDAPELDEERGEASRQYLTTLIQNKRLRCHLRGRDRYFRNLAICTLPDGTDIAAAMIEAGHASESRRFSKGYYRHIEPDRK